MSNRLTHSKKKAIEWGIKKYLKEYVEFDKKQIRAKGGVIEIDNLLIKKNAFEGLSQSIEVQYGCIGKIRIKISWFDRENENSVVEIEDVYAVLR